MIKRNLFFLLCCIVAAVFSAGVGGQSQIDVKTAFQEVDRMPRGQRSEAEWRLSQQRAASEAISRIGKDDSKIAGPDLYYLAMLESLAGQWASAAKHFQQYLALPEGNDQETRMKRISAQNKLREAFINGGMISEGEKYYSSDAISLGVFLSQAMQPERAVKVYEQYLASDPPPERARVAKSLIIIALSSAGKVDEMAKRVEEYRNQLTPNSLVNAYCSLSRLYYEAGDLEKSDKYTGMVLEMGKRSNGSKAVDGPVNAHIEWIIKRLEASGQESQLNSFLHRVRAELAENRAVMEHLDSRATFRSIINRPARELEIDYFLGGERVDLKSLRGRVVLLDFFAHWCGPCIAGFPFLRDLQKRYQDRGLIVLGVSGIYGYYGDQRPLTPEEEIERMRNHFTKEYQISWPMIFAKGELNKKNYGVSYIPQLVLIDREGIVRYARVGKGAEEEIEKEILKLL